MRAETPLSLMRRSLYRLSRASTAVPTCSANLISVAVRRGGCKWFLFLDRNCFRRGWRRIAAA